MRIQHLGWAAATALIWALVPPASAQQARTAMAMPGTVNYIEGQVAIDGMALNAGQNGRTAIHANQVLTTNVGRVEILLLPGVFLRAGDHSELRMVSADMVDPVVEVVRGEAMVEADRKDARTNVLQQGANASILKEGLYRFNADRGNIQVIDGKISLTANGQSKEIGRGREADLGGPKLKTVSFDRKAEDNLYQWSSIRSGYLAEASGYTAQNIYAGYPAPYTGYGWYWDPYFAAWSWMPGYGFFYSPFGYPFYSPGFAVYAGFGRGFGYGRPGFGGPRPAFRSGFAPGTSAMAARGFSGGGFHGGGGRR